METEPTKVVFRVWKDTGTVLALFPEHPGTNEAFMCNSYEHVGQHGAADYQGCIPFTRPAKFVEWETLARELEGLGYRLEVHQRATRRMHARRWK